MSAACAHALAQPVTYTIDPTHTIAVVELDHLGLATLRARFDRSSGSVTLDRLARRGRVEVDVEAASVSSGSAALDERLRGPALLDAARHPVMRFVAESLDFDGDRVAAARGQLILRGRTQALTLRAMNAGCYTNPLLQRPVCGGDYEAEVDLAAFGLAPDAALDGWGVRARLRVQVEGLAP